MNKNSEMSFDGDRYVYKTNGKLNNINGPAVRYVKNDRVEYWVNGIRTHGTNSGYPCMDSKRCKCDDAGQFPSIPYPPPVKDVFVPLYCMCCSAKSDLEKSHCHCQQSRSRFTPYSM